MSMVNGSLTFMGCRSRRTVAEGNFREPWCRVRRLTSTRRRPGTFHRDANTAVEGGASMRTNMMSSRWAGLGLAAVGLMACMAAVTPARAQSDTQAPWLGVYMQALTPELREGINYDG